MKKMMMMMMMMIFLKEEKEEKKEQKEQEQEEKNSLYLSWLYQKSHIQRGSHRRMSVNQLKTQETVLKILHSQHQPSPPVRQVTNCQRA